MNPKFIIAQIFGVIALIFIFISFKHNNKKYLLKMQAISNIVYSIQYLLLGAYTGVVMYLLGVLRNYMYEKFKKKSRVPIWVFMLIVTLMLTISLTTYKGTYSLFTIFGIIVYTWGLWQKNMTIARITEIIAILCTIIYNIFVKAYSGNITMLFELIFTLMAIYKFDIKKTKLKKTK